MNINELNEKINALNNESKRLNNERAVNIGKKETLTKQLESALAGYNQKYNANITLETLETEAQSVLTAKLAEVEKLEKAINAIKEGNFAIANETLDVKPAMDIALEAVMNPTVANVAEQAVTAMGTPTTPIVDIPVAPSEPAVSTPVVPVVPNNANVNVEDFISGLNIAAPTTPVAPEPVAPTAPVMPSAPVTPVEPTPAAPSEPSLGLPPTNFSAFMGL